MIRKISLFLVAIIILSSTFLSACGKEETVGFGIYLVDSGELMLSDRGIRAYYKDTHTIGLNEKGIERWNSFQTYTGIPKLNDTLFSKDFVVKLEGREMYRGKFWSMASSAITPDIIIYESLFKLDSENNTISIGWGMPPSSFDSGQDPRDNPEIISFFRERGLLK